MSKSSPMIEQFWSIKNEHEDKLVFFQVGDFYELFYEDARIGSQELDLVLTTRDSDKENPVPLAGIPIHAVDNYLARLLEKGYKVAICDQTEDASQAKGLVKREVTRIVTPGTVTDENMLSETQNNYIMSLVKDGENYYGIAITDVSTGDFWATEISGEDAMDMIKAEWQRITPAEVICTSWMMEDRVITECRQLWDYTMIEEVSEEFFYHTEALEQVKKQWHEQEIESFLSHRYPLAVSATGALLKYLRILQKTSLNHLQPVKLYFPGEYMIIDGITRKNLELTQTIREGRRKGSLLDVIDYTCTSMGGRLLKRWIEQPLKDVEKIRERSEAVNEFSGNSTLKNDLRQILDKIYDLERLCSRVNYGNVNARDLVALKESLELLPNIKEIISSSFSSLLQDLSLNLPEFAELVGLLEKSLVENPPLTVKEGGIIKDGYSEEVDYLRRLTRESKDWLLEIEQQERERTGIKSLKVSYNRVYGYYIEVTKNNLHLVPKDYHRKQTLVNAERYITDELKKIEEDITGSNDKLCTLEYKFFEELREKVLSFTSDLQYSAQILSQLDCLQGLGEAALVNRYRQPDISAANDLELKQVRHPVIEKMNFDERFVPNDVFMNHEQKMLIITGPNMAGKSTYCRSVALACLLAQVGSFIPADSAYLPVFDRIFARVGSSDDLSAGQSTFMVEMNETASILKEATPQTLVILDEIGRGTSTYDGMSIARSVLEYINKYIGSWTLFSTHYHELTVLENELPGVKNYTVAVKERGKSVIFLRKVVPGKADKSYGINVARLAGLPTEVIDRAETILKEAESASNNSPRNSVKQIDLFEFTEEHVKNSNETKRFLEDLKEKDLDVITPLEALQDLFYLQSLIRKDEQENNDKEHDLNGHNKTAQ